MNNRSNEHKGNNQNKNLIIYPKKLFAPGITNNNNNINNSNSKNIKIIIQIV
jgi:hypothetical protein